MQQPPWMPLAWAELGQRETAGSESNARIAEYFHRVGHADLADDSVAWCAAFTGACLERAGLSSTRSLRARSYLDWGHAVGEAAYGAIAVLSRGSDPALGHVGFVVGSTEREIILLGGNQSNAVTVGAFDRRRLLALRMPTTQIDGMTRAADDDRFDSALVLVLDQEGGWSNDAFDPGGPTNKGITLAVFARERGEEVTAENAARLEAELKRIPDHVVARIYRDRYWHPARCPLLPPALALFHFDCSVNQGVNAASRMLQEALAVDVDGEIGPITLAAARDASLLDLLDAYAEIRRRRYRNLAHFWRFGRGWLARVERVHRAARELATSAGPLPGKRTPETYPKPRKEKRTMEPIEFDETSRSNAPPASGKWWGESMTIWGALITAFTTVAPALLAALGINIPLDIIQKLGTEAMTVIQALVGLAGTILTIVGRARASAPLQRRPVRVRL